MGVFYYRKALFAQGWFFLHDVAFEKCLAGAGFEVAFEFSSLLIVVELQSNQYFPRPIFGCVWGLPLIMSLEAIFQISR